MRYQSANVPYRMPLRGMPHPFRRGLGAASSNLATAGEGATLVTAGVTAGSAIAAGATIGSVAGPIGAAVGAVAGIVAGILTPSPNTAAPIGSWDSQLVNALAQLPSTVAGVGRQIPWNENSHGLVQYLEALLACGQYMSWDTSLITNYDVCAHWAMTLSAAAQTVATAVCKNPAGASVTVQITSQPGGPVGPAPFTFKNPAINSGPEAVTDAVIMGPNGVMVWLFSRWQIASTAALSKQYANMMGSNTPATKVYALMVDYVAGTLNVPDTIPATPVPDVSAIPAKASAAVVTATTAAPKTTTPVAVATPIATPAPVIAAPAPPVVVPATPTPVATTSSGSTVSDADIASAIQSMQQQGASQSQAISAALAQLESQGVDTSSPPVQTAVQNAVAPSTGLTSTDWLLIIGGIGAVWWLTRK
jgi:hypothetical protein